jgi:hypothetical protein
VLSTDEIEGVPSGMARRAVLALSGPWFGSGLGCRQLRQDLLADLFEHVAGAARAVLEVKDDVIDPDRA